MNKEELKLYNSRTPEEYITNSLKSKLPQGRKAHVTKQWLMKTNYSVEDIQHARNRHPYWKTRKMSGSVERNQMRMIEHNYTTNKPVVWDEDAVKEFIQMNKKDKKGVYINKDFELARHFRSTIPSIQHYRRKYNMVIALFNKEGISPTVNNIYKYIIKSELLLRNMLK